MAQRAATPSGGRRLWVEALRVLLALYLARAARRVLARRAEHPEAGRAGGAREASPAHPWRAGSRATPAAEPARRPEGRPARAARQEAARGASGWAVLRRTFVEFGRDHGTLMAAAVAFYLLLSLVPLVVVGVAVFGFVLTDAEARRMVLRFAAEYLPRQEALLESSITAVQSARGTLGLVGLGTLLLTATGGFATLETAINITWKAPNRSFVWNKLYALLMMGVVGVLLVASVGISALMNWAAVLPGLGWLVERLPGPWIGVVLTLAISGLMFTAIYKFFPNVPVAWKPALISGFATAVLWEAFKNGYLWYTSLSAHGEAATHGALAGFVGLLMWIYYSCALVLLGSELTWVLQGCPGEEGPAPA